MTHLARLLILLALLPAGAAAQIYLPPNVGMPPTSVIGNTQSTQGNAVAVTFTQLRAAIGVPTAKTCGASTWFNSMSSLGVFGCVQPARTDISGFGTGVATALGVNIGSAGAPVLFNGALGTPTSGSAANLTLGANQVTRANLAQGVARSVVGVTGNATANIADIQGATAHTFLGVDSAGTGISFRSLRQIIPLTMNTVPLAQATTNFTVSLGNATETLVQALCPIAGTFRNLFIRSTAPASGQTLTATLRVNTADTSLACVVTGTGTTCSDTTNTAACTAGQPYALKLVTSATTGSLAFISGGVEFDSP